MNVLAEYVDFGSLQTTGAAPSTPNTAAAPSEPPSEPEAAASPTAELKRGMKMDEVTALFGQGRQLSESVSTDGLKTQVLEYLPGDRRVEVTYVEGLVVRYSITSEIARLRLHPRRSRDVSLLPERPVVRCCGGRAESRGWDAGFLIG